jgi:prolyl-tRNA editing enzyme YbaK/EbsC (Cys-tRNA(Pro) deacylase)
VHPTAERFREKVRWDHDLDLQVHTFPEDTRTAEDAAEAVGCPLEAVAKTLVFDVGPQVLAVVASGAHEVDEAALAEHYDVDPHEVGPVDPDEVEGLLGWPVGGVPPLGHVGQVPRVVDELLVEQEEIWAAAGAPNALFPIDPEALVEAADAQVRSGFFTSV